MSVTTFAAIDVGSNELSMKIFELTDKNVIRKLNHVRHVMELGSDTYANGYISTHMIDELCEVLKDFTMIMKDYGVTEYRAYATSSIREAGNRHFLLDRVRVRTGINVIILSNPEQRFLMLQALALNEPDFNNIIKHGAIVLESGSGSSQATCFSNGKMITSQNLRLGSIRINEFLKTLERSANSYFDLLKEYIAADINTTYRKHFIKYKIKTILAVGEGLNSLCKYVDYYMPGCSVLDAKQMNDMYNSLMKLSLKDLARIAETSEEQARLIRPTAMIYKQIMDINNAEHIKFNVTDLCDGMAYEYAVSVKKLIPVRNFDGDILSAIRKIAIKYGSNSDHTSYVEKIALGIFDAFKESSGLSGRDRLLMQAAIRMHDIGTYVSFQNIEKNSAHIILSSDIIGLTSRETHIVAGIVRYKVTEFPALSDMEYNVCDDDYMKIAKLTAIYRLANSLDTSKCQKLKNVTVSNKNDKLIISCDTFMDLTLELASFDESCAFFKQIFGIVPKLKQRRIINV